ncbi:MAG: hypothetical protein R3356_09285 [Eudoraea sp.]|nr:hypothetical protein [Eudoraea sp.]
MKLTPPIVRKELESRPKLSKKYNYLERLVKEISNRDLTEYVIALLNKEIEALNAVGSMDKQFSRELGKKKSAILKTLEKELKIVPKHYYRTLWMVLGMSVFGVPLGVAFGAALDNMAFLSIGFGAGMAIGIGLGSGLDEKAKKEGRQLDIEQTF